MQKSSATMRGVSTRMIVRQQIVRIIAGRLLKTIQF